MNDLAQEPQQGVEPAHLGVLITLVAASLFAIALSGLPNLMDNERRIAAYVLDAVQHGNWICQRDTTGELASKPPLYTWIAAVASLPFGRINRFALYLPSVMATMLVALILYRVGRTQFGWQSGFLAAMIYLLSPLADRQMNMARYDGLLTLPVALGAFAAYRAWVSGRGWTWFWLAGAAATMVKGPLGLALSASGLLAAWWEKRSGTPLRLRGSHWVGVSLFLLICGGWFCLAYWRMGPALIDKLIGRELVGHAVGSDTSHFPLEYFYQPTLNFLRLFAPWSLLAVLGLWRVGRKASEDAATRRFERFLFCWFLTGLLIFSAAAHQRGRLIFPLVPPAALLAGRELARWLRAWSPERMRRVAIGAAAAFLLIIGTYRHVLLQRSGKVQETLGMRALARDIQRRFGEQFPLNHVDSPVALQFYLNTARPQISTSRAAEILSGDYPAVVTVGDMEQLRSQLSATTTLYEIARWPATNEASVRVVSNVPLPESTNRWALAIGPLSIQMEDARLIRTKGEELEFAAVSPTANVTVSNYSSQSQAVSLRFAGGGAAFRTRVLEPKQSWHQPAKVDK